MSYAILRTAKLKKIGNIAGSLHHTLRSIDTPNADPNRTHLNQNTYDDTPTALKAIKAKLPKKRRSDAVLCIEYLVTGSPEWDGWGKQKQDDYFKNAIDWLKDKHGADNVVMTSIQLDETTPHMVAYVVPLDDNGKLNAKKFLGGRDVLKAMQTDFADKVGIPLGLERGIEGSKSKHQTIKKYYANINNAVKIAPEIAIDLPEKGLFEKHDSYENRVFELLDKEISPILDRTLSLQNELAFTKQRLGQANKHIQDLQKDTAVYRNAVKDLPPDTRGSLDRAVSATGKDLLADYQAKIQAEYRKEVARQHKEMEEKFARQEEQREKREQARREEKAILREKEKERMQSLYTKRPAPVVEPEPKPVPAPAPEPKPEPEPAGLGGIDTTIKPTAYRPRRP